MYRTIYISAASGPVDEAVIQGLLEVSRRNNARLGVTGLMLYHDGNFLQVLEGEEAVVTALYDRIALDGRHRGVIRLLGGPITERAFPDWQMGYVPLDALGAEGREGVVSLIALAQGQDAGTEGALARDRAAALLIRSFLRNQRDLAARMQA